jgi:hypothetical protein
MLGRFQDLYNSQTILATTARLGVTAYAIQKMLALLLERFDDAEVRNDNVA